MSNKHKRRASIFQETSLGGIHIRNRLVRSATWEGMGTSDGAVTSRILRLYENLVEGGVGLIISSYLYVRLDGKQNVGQLGVDSDEMIPGLTDLAGTVHSMGGRLIGQIVHCGGQANRQFNGGVVPVAPSSIESPGYPEVPRSFSTDEVWNLITDFAEAARRLRDSGFDGVQLHGAHGYLLSQFLSPLRNRRTDEFGGSLRNRARLTVETLRAIRKKVGPDFPVLIKLNVNDYLSGSTTEVDSCFLATELAREGITSIEVSGGTPGSGRFGAVRRGIKKIDDEAYFRQDAKAIRRLVPETPLILVGGLRSIELIEEILESGEADYFALCRPLIREPTLPNRWNEGDRKRAACESCLGCFGPTRRGEGVRCVRTQVPS